VSFVRPPISGTDDAIVRIVAALIARIGSSRYHLWFAENSRILLDGREIVFAARNSQFRDWAAEKFGPTIRDAVREAVGEMPVRFAIDSESADAEPPKIVVPTGALGPVPSQLNLFGEPSVPLPPKAIKKQFKTEQEAVARQARKWKTFAEFAVGPSNRVAWAAALAVAEEPGLGPNPLVLHGPVGTGKTHLLEAIHAAWRKQTLSSRPVFVTAEEFTHRFVQGTRFNKMGPFRRHFRECSALLFDDLHFLANKRGSMEEFLYTLDALVTDGRQVVVTSDCHPRLAEEFLPELVDRLLGGAAWGLLPPDDETRLDILRRKAIGAQPPVGDDVLKFLARNLKGNVRELEGAINGVRHYAKVSGQAVGVGAAREALGDLLRHTVRAVTVADVDSAVCIVLRLSSGQLQSKSRSWQVSHPRMFAIFLARKHTAATYGEIAKHFGVRQHSTAVAAEKRVRAWLAANEAIALGDRRWTAKDLVDRIERELQK
jgi:chromosomal replication initiator protein